MTTNNSKSPRGATAARATAVAAAVLFTDMLLHGLAIPVLPLLPAVVEQGPAATGILFSSYAVAMIIASLISGRIVDRYGPKTPLVIGLIGLAVATALFALGGPYWLLLLARFAQGIAGGMSWVASLSLIAATTGFEKRGQMMGIAMATVTLGILVGPPLSGFLVDAIGPAAPFLLAAGIAIVDLILLLVLITGSPKQTDDTTGPLAVFKVPGSASIVVAIAIGAAVLAAVQPVLPVHLGEQASSTMIGLLFGIAALASIIANPIVGRFVATSPPRLLIGCGIAAVVAALLVTGLSTQLWQTGIGMALLGLSSALLLAPATTLISEQGFKSDPPTLGGSFALYNLAYAAGLALGPQLTGIGVEQGGFTTAMIVAAIVLAVLGGAALTRLPRRQQNEAQSN
ncbi:MFS transporter [Auritidibacter ignavus]|uniref:MFS transporter n=1 Tax=Auritidibacter ignavus TaxID=678932 RepID=UPI000D727C82|nr:MFS transporter [Auritidibacter ignavus]PXA75146.1 MFS transporter [Auritidibacter sp. NML120779]WHS28104.1 MFS transporter [Auritidibacter ignavus]